MAFAARGSRCIFGMAYPFASRGTERIFGTPTINTPLLSRARNKFSNIVVDHGSRRYYQGSSSGASSQNWDGLVYSIMSNIRGPTTHGPECFYHSDDSDSNDDSTSPTLPIPDKSRRDIRDEIPLALKRNYVLETASDMALRIKYLEKPSQGSEDYERVMKLQKLLVWLGNMSSDNPKLDLQEYIEIWTIIGDGLEAANGLLFQVITLSEERHIKHIKWNAECVWGVAMLNAAVRKLEPTIIETSDPNEYEDTKKSGSGERLTFEGNLGALSGKIHGLLLDSKDFWPDGKRWFNKNEEEKILEAVWMVHCEGKRRD